MIVEYIRYRIGDDGRAAFEAAYRRAAVYLSAAPQCVDYELTRCLEEPASHVLRITWTSTRDHLEGFRGSENFGRFLAEIQPYLPAVEEMRHYERTDVVGQGGAGQGGQAPSLYEWAGGAAALDKLFEAFYSKVRNDELLEPLFRDMDREHPRHVALWLGEVFGGPSRYTDECGGYRHMVSRHLGKAISEAQRRRWVNLLLDAADEVGLPGDPEFRAAFVGYIEWGTRIAMANSAPDARPVTEAPVPRWGWGVAPPYVAGAGD